ncbi:MAG: hypothetical protein GX318_03135 [Clostridia bacterium]|nr:hypothetical protein [Clostridia bacterium]
MKSYDPRLTPLNNIRPRDHVVKKKKSGAGHSPFGEVLRDELEGLKFSRHAENRLKSMGVSLEPGKMAELETAVAKARGKESKDALVLMGDMAFVVSVKNNTVVTVVNEARMKENVFTNIDSAVIV